MAAAETEPAKLLLPYLQRADELQKHEPLVAYYCRLYAMERGLKIPQSGRTKTTNSILVSLMNQLEKDKKSLKLSPDDHLHLEGFALNVFAKADKEDRAGRADLNTAKTFYAASIFFEILNQFGELAPDLEQKQKYAVWKAADIRKALKEGRKPVPGPPGGEKDQATPSGTADGASDLEPSHIDRSPQVDPSPPVDPSSQMDTSPFPRPQDEMEPRPYIPPPSSFYPSHYPANDYSSPHPTNGADTSAYAQPFPNQSYPQEPQHHIPQHYPSQDVPSPFTYPNFQSYPSFSESSLPAAATHYPSYPQGPDASYPHLPNSSAPNYASPPQHSSIDGNGTVPGAVSAPPAQAYQYDSNYQVPPEKIAEAHKAARFAVGALAFDDVFVAVDYLKKSLDLLTNPSAKH
ncbi:HOMOLOG OF MAMMALIAN LYST-INTERACTING PROTEIN 5-like protein [Drosera capensis]